MLFPPLRRAGLFRPAAHIPAINPTRIRNAGRSMEAVMPEPQSAPYGSWSSPITSDLIVASSIGLGEIMLDGTDVYWIESRPQEGGRSIIVRRAADGSSSDVTPPLAPGNGV